MMRGEQNEHRREVRETRGAARSAHPNGGADGARKPRARPAHGPNHGRNRSSAAHRRNPRAPLKGPRRRREIDAATAQRYRKSKWAVARPESRWLFRQYDEGRNKMNIDERLEKLVERHEALTQTVELMAHENRERDRRMDQVVSRLDQVVEAISRLLHVAEIH